MTFSRVTLRPAKQADLYFLFIVSTLGMLPVRKARNPDLCIDLEREFADYSRKFDPSTIQVVQLAGVDVGRLRVERAAGSIYIGGIQILKAFQGQGIGSAVIGELIEESARTGASLDLHVSRYNAKARQLYERLGFRWVADDGTNHRMVYSPKTT